MTPSARVQAAIELLDEIVVAAREGGAAADTLIARYFKTRRYAGSKDRRAVRDLVFRAIRRAGERPASGRTAMLGLVDEDPALAVLFDGSAHGPAAVGDGEAAAAPGVAPAWLLDRFDPELEPSELPALLDRAPLDLRVNRLRGMRDDALIALPGAVATPHAPLGLRLPEGTQIEPTEVWASGLVEVQDEGSQLLGIACEAKSDELVVDLCAGAGGKTLGLAADMDNRGRLGRMAPRLARAGVTIVETRLLDPGRERAALADLAGTADVVLVDAPCSGTGTWRRNPEARWRLTPERLARLVKLQADLLDIAAELVRPDGHLVYAVCSLLAEEGRAQADMFEARHSAFVRESMPIKAGRTAGPGLLLRPARDGTDGFFVARWRRPC